MEGLAAQAAELESQLAALSLATSEAGGAKGSSGAGAGGSPPGGKEEGASGA